MESAVGRQRDWSGPYVHASRPQAISTNLGTTSSMPASTFSMASFSDPFIDGVRSSGNLYINTALDHHTSPPPYRSSISSPASSQFQYATSPITTTSASSPVVPQPMYDQTFLNHGGLLPTDFSFSTAPSPVSGSFSQSSFDLPTGQFMASSMGGLMDYTMDVNGPRRSSQPHINSHLASSHSVLSADQETPRAPYAPSQRGSLGSLDSYNFPPAHSTHSSTSSISSSSGSNFSQYCGMDNGSGISDYSDVDASMPPPLMRSSRTKSIVSDPSPIPAQASMMTQFSSKVPNSVQKKHVCKVCEKRFTRPSSLQTHVYSHTGEKPYQCDHPGCGRCFSVVSNLRRHQKIHRGRDHSIDPSDSRSEAESPVSHTTDYDD